MEKAVEAVATTVSTKLSYATGLGSAALGWLGSNQFAVVIGTLATLGTFLVNWYYKHEAHKRTIRLDKMREARIERGQRTDTDLAPLGEDD